MPPHSLMPSSIPPDIRAGRRPREAQIRQSADDPYGAAGFHGDGLKHVVKKPLRVNGGSAFVNEYIDCVDVIPGEPLFVIAQLKRLTIEEGFVRQSAKTPPTDLLVFTAKARIGLNQAGSCTVSADVKQLRIRIGDAGGRLRTVSVKMPPYDPNKLAIEYRNNLIIVSA